MKLVLRIFNYLNKIKKEGVKHFTNSFLSREKKLIWHLNIDFTSHKRALMALIFRLLINFL